MDEPGVVSIARRQQDPLRAFCDELNTPLEEVFNLLYLATHVNAGADSERNLKQALERLAKVRRVVLSHCQDPQQRQRAS